MSPCHAIDFGTSNSLIAYVPSRQEARIMPLEAGGEQMLKSLIFTPQNDLWYFGKEAIAQYQEWGGEGRFFKSIKKFLPEPSYSGTMIHEKKYKIEELIATILRAMRERTNQATGADVDRLVLGRPALYSRVKEQDDLAQERMLKAARLAGYKHVEFCPEPLAAGLDYRAQSGKERIVLVADFGGGTSDFTLLRMHGGEYSPDDVLGLSGVFLAGDAFDGVIMRESISPHFGKNVCYRLPMGGNLITFPKILLGKLCSPAHMAHLKERDTWEFLKEIRTWSVSGENKKQIDQLFALVEHQLGHVLFDHIERSKIELGARDQTRFHFKLSGIDIQEDLQRRDFQEHSRETVDRIMDSLMEVFRQSGLAPAAVDEICLTGGTAQSPFLRERLKQVFPEEKLKVHKVYQSVVGGLAKFAQQTYLS